MGYSFKSRVRYSEIGENRHLRLPAMLEYFQDSCTFHSEDIGQGMDVVEKRKRAWVLSGWQIVIDRYPKMGEEITIYTAPYDFRGFMGNRNFALYAKDGECLAKANSFWTHIHTETGRPEKLVEEDIKGYDLAEKLEMDYAPRKISIPKEMESKDSFPVQRHHLDTNHHVNNVQYVRMAEDYLPDGIVVEQVRVEYKMQARLSDILYPEVAYGEKIVTVTLNNEKKQPYAIIEFTCSRVSGEENIK